MRYKLRMFGIPITGPTRVLCDNESVVKNSSKFESTLNKKHNAIAYHMTRWATAAKEIIMGWIKSGENLADSCEHPWGIHECSPVGRLWLMLNYVIRLRSYSNCSNI